MDRTQSKTRSSALRLAVTGGLSLVVLASLGFAAVNLDLDGFSFEPRPALLVVAIAFFALMSVFETLRLDALARFKASRGLKALGINGAAMALVQAPFGLVGAEAYRANAYVRRGEALSPVLAAILVARALGLACMLVLLALAAGFLTEQVPAWVKTLSALVAAVGFTIIALGPALLRRWRPHSVPGRMAEFGQALAALTASQLVWAIVWSFLIVLARAFALWACAAGFGAPIPLAFAVFGSAAGLFIALVPFISGVIGVREGGIAGVLLLAGLPLATGVLVGFTMRIGAVAGALITMAVSHLINPKVRL